MALGYRFCCTESKLTMFLSRSGTNSLGGRGRTAQFVPIRFVSRNKLHRDDKLLLALDGVWNCPRSCRIMVTANRLTSASAALEYPSFSLQSRLARQVGLSRTNPSPFVQAIEA